MNYWEDPAYKLAKQAALKALDDARGAAYKALDEALDEALDKAYNDYTDALAAAAKMVEDAAKADMTHSEKLAKLTELGFICGPRDPRLNTNYLGAFMVVEEHEEHELPTEDGSNGPWCVVGDDFEALVAQAWDVWGPEYADNERRALLIARSEEEPRQ